ncbi:MAG: hypothetical protein R3286_11880 [Gammaproteobacteria bacterium]|nr:hypothetical protein [Gammaproteobacteria bacterium]
MRIVDYAIAADGGTQVIVLELDNGERLTFGLDGRIGAPGGGRQLFVGASPDGPSSRLLPVGGTEEAELVALLEDWLDRTQGFLRRESLMTAESAALDGQDRLDRLAMELLLEVRGRADD